MKNKIWTIFASIAIVLSASFVIVSFASSQDNSVSEFCDLVIKMREITLSHETVLCDISLPSELTEEQKDEIKADYETQLDSVFTLSATSREIYLSTMDRILNSERTERDAVTELGVFSIKVNEFNLEATTASAIFDMEIYTKYITEEDGKFHVYFPLDREQLKVDFENTENGWRIADQELLSNPAMVGDYEKEKVFDTYEEALEYANCTQPDNLIDKYTSISNE